MKNKIVIICPYFGKLPMNVNFTFQSMQTNKLIDWIIFTDDDTSQYNYNNIQFIKCEFAKIQELIKQKIGTNISKVYKLCDYKPLYGKIFEDYLTKYEFWGYCDLDMVFGDLSIFLTNDKLKKYDKIYDLGHFSIYKNTQLINTSYRLLDKYYTSYKYILNDDSIYVIDETYDNHISINEILELQNKKVYRDRTEFKDIYFRFKNLYPVGEKGKKFIYYQFSNGKLFQKSLINSDIEEIAYVHFQKRNFETYFFDGKMTNFLITPKGFIDEQELSKKSFYYGWDLKLVLYFKVRFKRYKMNVQRKITNFLKNI